MSITVRIPAQLRELTGGNVEIEVEGDTVRGVISALGDKYPGINERLLDESGALRRFINVFLADEDVRFLDGLDTEVETGQTLSVIPAVAGG